MPWKVYQHLGPHGVSSHLVLIANWRRQLAGAVPAWPASPPPLGSSPKIRKGSSVNTERDTAMTVTNKITQRLPAAGRSLGLLQGLVSQGEHSCFVLSPSPTNRVSGRKMM